MPAGVALVVAAGYVVGSIPVANMLARRRAGVDLREVGDRNPGFWNARRVLDVRAATVVFLCDMAKGAAAAGFGVALAPEGGWWWGYAGAMAAMIGHAWPMFDGWRGGRGVLTFCGAMIVLSPISAAIAIGLLGITLAATRRFDVAARVAVFGLPFVQLAVDAAVRTAATGMLMCVIGARFALAALRARPSTEPSIAAAAPGGTTPYEPGRDDRHRDGVGHG